MEGTRGYKRVREARQEETRQRKEKKREAQTSRGVHGAGTEKEESASFVLGRGFTVRWREDIRELNNERKVHACGRGIVGCHGARW
jgi:hypothetical protein